MAEVDFVQLPHAWMGRRPACLYAHGHPEEAGKLSCFRLSTVKQGNLDAVSSNRGELPVWQAEQDGEGKWGWPHPAPVGSYKAALKPALAYISHLMQSDRKLGPLKQLQVCTSSLAALQQGRYLSTDRICQVFAKC